MTWTSTMSSGYSSLEEDSEEYFFTARTSFFKKPQGKLTDRKDVEKSRLRTHFSREEIQNKILLYNSVTQDHLKMTLHSSGLYTGFIKVQLELRRPITVRGGGGGGGVGGAAGPGGVRAGGGGGEEAFYLPRGAVNTLHVSSTNTVRQVIEALLNKFTVADNPAKFALYKRCKREEQVYICKLSEDEQPLFLRLLAGPNTDTLGFVLREQQTGEVMWDAFSIPELHNFLRILDKEEQDHLRVITHRYDTYKQKLEEALKAAGPG
ncbi:ras association domain-containing protein 3 [Sardina pilchardus]|uniref:ras association domain-containing protein 3 n=1 Tax=Sardina pilchardus TaxID=27697 RepID=UPI002E11942F